MDNVKSANPMGNRVTPLFKRLAIITWKVLSNPFSYFSTYRMDDSRWVSYLYSTTWVGLFVVFFHVFEMAVKEVLPELVKLLLLLLLDYFSILIFLPLAIFVLQFLTILVLKITGEAAGGKRGSRQIFNVYSYSSAAVFFYLIPVFGDMFSYCLFVALSLIGLRSVKDAPLWKLACANLLAHGALLSLLYKILN